MSKNYKYSRSLVFLTGGLGASIPIFILTFLVFATFSGKISYILWLIIFSCLLTSIAVIIWMIALLNIEIVIDNIGINYVSPFRKITIDWSEILNVSRTNYIDNISYFKYLPKRNSYWNIEIKTTKNKKLSIYHFLKNIKDLVAEIERHVPIDNYFYISNSFVFNEVFSTKRKIVKFALLTTVIAAIIFLRSNLVLLSLILFLLLIIRFTWFKGKIKIRLLANNSGLILEGNDFWRITKCIPWHIIKSVKLINENEGPIVIETLKDQMSLWNSTDINENSRLYKLIEEKITDLRGHVRLEQIRKNQS